MTIQIKDFYIGKKIDFVMAPEDRPKSLDQALDSTYLRNLPSAFEFLVTMSQGEAVEGQCDRRPVRPFHQMM